MSKDSLLKYKDISVGDIYPKFYFKITEKCIEHYLNATESHFTWFFSSTIAQKEGFPGKVVPPILFGQIQAIKDVLPLQMPDGTLHTKHKFEFYRPIMINEKLTFLTKVTDKHQKKGRNYVVMESRILDEGEDIVAFCQWTFLWPI